MMIFARCHDSGTVARLRSVLAKPYSGTLVAAAIAFVALILLTGAYVFGLNWADSWRLVGIPVATHPFYDFYVIPSAAAKCAAVGEPYPYVTCGYQATNFNYPPVWLLLGKLGVSGADAVWLAVCFELMAIGLIIVLLRGYSLGLGFVALPLVLSPSIVLGFERGNIDIVEWIAVCLAALVYSERRKLALAASAGLLMLAVAIKFLAVFCCAITIRLRWSAILITVAVIGFTALYLYSLDPVLGLIRSITPVSPYISYGYIIIFNRLEFLYAPRLGLDLAGLTQSWIPVVCVTSVIVAAVGSALVIWRSGRRVCRISDDRTGTAFIFGAGIYCGSFLLLGTSFAYRLIFLLLCVPQLFDWIERSAPDRSSRRMSWLLLACFAVSMWLKFRPEMTWHVNQISDWMIFGLLSMVLALNALYALGQPPFRIGAILNRAADR
jgi:hypothetical protein